MLMWPLTCAGNRYLLPRLQWPPYDGVPVMEFRSQQRRCGVAAGGSSVRRVCRTGRMRPHGAPAALQPDCVPTTMSGVNVLQLE